MKRCPKCEKMNNPYAGVCDLCGADISHVSDIEPESVENNGSSIDEIIPDETDSAIVEPMENQDHIDLDSIYNQLEDIKAQLSRGSTLFDVNMPFGRMVAVITKIILASIPAILIVGFLFSIFWVFIGGLLFRVLFQGYGVH